MKKRPPIRRFELFERIFGQVSMDRSIRLFVEWPDGSHLPVRLSRGATGEDLLDLISFCCRDDQQIILVFDGTCLNPRVQLCQQRIQENSTIKVVKLSDSFSDFIARRAESSPLALGEDSFESICPELLRITDLQFSIVEGHRNGGQLFRSMLMEQSDSDESDFDQPRTVLPLQPAEIPRDPLPPLERFSDSDDEVFDRFDNVKQADEPESSILHADGFKPEWHW
jgi:hypothetical protein